MPLETLYSCKFLITVTAMWHPLHGMLHVPCGSTSCGRGWRNSFALRLMHSGKMREHVPTVNPSNTTNLTGNTRDTEVNVNRGKYTVLVSLQDCKLFLKPPQLRSLTRAALHRLHTSLRRTAVGESTNSLCISLTVDS